MDEDALDILRLLQATDLDVFVGTLQAVPVDSPEQEDVVMAMEALATQAPSPDSPLPRLAQTASGDDPTVAASFVILVDELLRAL